MFAGLVSHLATLWPHNCLLCGKSVVGALDLCHACLAELPWNIDACEGCGLTLSAASGQCGPCLRQPPSFKRTIALFNYDAMLAQCILALKYQRRLAYGRLLGRLLAQHLPGAYQADRLPDAVIPMPLHKTRLQVRGFNQALELALPLKQYLKLPLLTRQCRRIKSTLPQASSPAYLRQKNLQHAFEVAIDLRGRHVAIVDDVITTGATVRALTEALLAAGAKRVDVWCAARTQWGR